MEFNNKKLERTSKWINYLIALVLCGFLISLSSQFMGDIDDWEGRPTVEEFRDQAFVKKQKAALKKLYVKRDYQNEKRSSIQKTIEAASKNYRNEKKSYDNWLAARKTVGSPSEDKEILSRANKLDAHYKTEQEWRAKMALIDDTLSVLGKDITTLQTSLSDEKEIAYTKQEEEIRAYDLKVFLIRLFIVLPILGLGIFFIIKFRKHKYWPIFLGYVMFSFYAFFFGLVPYLPSYGGYIRYTVGIVLSILFGMYAINKIKAFIEKKKSELKVPSNERAKKVQLETAERALANHMCPSCGKDFILKKWDKDLDRKFKAQGYGIVTNFCRYCGLELFKPCTNCGTENYAHLPYCSKCGTSIISEK
ncbi:zinc ribbon domain-containing protein [Flammeovirga kamogawensis]|uniref:Zinc ribbon domain-containing protein n=1 Tax=Flammeovirga kamogawensis TaxID=373891 RepID=A0ABX8GXR8_9BACT|nr:zinc ribbon domain-containing protein [Flammeovirga kamogawensis]MBB6462804.1 ribosomal protein L32 [Flammeovirga kamogawensis]QWG08410.1 hypothetical protein KM029_05605 [Flammeovirga kamogawensis]TRX66706.1 hypothetical protein EO216_00660 [Flammeovirga kamogawensis]